MFTAVDDDSGLASIFLFSPFPAVFAIVPDNSQCHPVICVFFSKQLQDRQLITELYILHLLLTWRSTYTDEFAGLYGHVHIVQALTDNYDAKG